MTQFLQSGQWMLGHVTRTSEWAYANDDTQSYAWKGSSGLIIWEVEILILPAGCGVETHTGLKIWLVVQGIIYLKNCV